MSAQAHHIAPPRPAFAARVLLCCIAVYRVSLGQFIGGNCRFEPSCSRYAQLAIAHHGARRGSRFVVRRLLSCHPWHAGGLDQVPSGHFSVPGAQQRDDL